MLQRARGRGPRAPAARTGDATADTLPATAARGDAIGVWMVVPREDKSMAMRDMSHDREMTSYET